MGLDEGREHTGDMNASDPLSSQRVSDEQRDRAVDYLQQAYASGAIEADVFEDRLGEALSANTRAELNRALRDVGRVAAPLLAAKPPVAHNPAVSRAENVGAGLVHLAGIPTVFLGPAIVKAAATPGSRLWWEAGRAMSFQVSSLIVGATMFTLATIMGGGFGLVFMAYLFYLLLTVIFSVRAFNGDNSTGAIGNVLPFKPRDPKRPPALGPR